MPRRGEPFPAGRQSEAQVLFHGLDGDAEAVGDLRLGNFVDLVHDENGLAARRKRGDGVDQCLELALGLMATHGRRRHAGDFRKLGDGFHPGGSTTVATIAAHGGVVGDFPQQGQGRVHVLLLVAFEQLHAHVVHHFARHAPVAEAPANMVDQFLVVTNQCGQQRRLGGIERHDAPRKGAWLRRMGVECK